MLPCLPSLVELAIERCPGAAQLPALWHGLPRCSKLRTLRITGGGSGSRLPSGLVFGSGAAHSMPLPAFAACAGSGQGQPPAAHAFKQALAAAATVPETIALLQQLRRLDLSDNGLQLLPGSLAWCQQLTAVRLAGNRLAGVPQGLAALGGLRLLDLSCNQVGVWLTTWWLVEEVRVWFRKCRQACWEGSAFAWWGGDGTVVAAVEASVGWRLLIAMVPHARLLPKWRTVLPPPTRPAADRPSPLPAAPDHSSTCPLSSLLSLSFPSPSPPRS